MNRIKKMSLEYNSKSCCRVCLMTDCRLYDIHEYELADALSQISGTPVSRDKLPQNLCAFCFVLLLKCSSFQDMCLRTKKLLKEKMDINYIRRHQLPQRCLNLTQTEVEIIDITSEANVKYESDEEMLIEALDEDAVVVETYMEDEHKAGTSFILKDDDTMVMKTDTSDDDMLIERLDDYDIETLECATKISDVLKEGKNTKRNVTPEENEVIKIGKGFDRNVRTEKDNTDKMKMLTIELKNNKIEFKVASDIGNDDSNYEQLIEYYRRKANGRVNRVEVQQRLNPCDDEMFEKIYNHKIVALSTEDQLEEIANRKKSQNYTKTHFRCEDCGFGFNSEVTLYNHRTKHDPSIGPHSCEICNMRFKTPSDVRLHVQRNHRYKLLCNDCNFVSKLRQQAKTHYEMHAGKTFDCQYCEKSFTKPTSYFSHVRLRHPEQNVVCDQCGEGFISDKGLREHKNKAHAVKFQCSTCSATFLNVEALTVHNEVEGEHSGLWPCEQCGENCASQDELVKHVEETHPPRHCGQCDMTFTNPVAFDTHMRCKHKVKRPKPTSTCAKRKRPRYRRCAQKPEPRMCDQCGVSVASSAMLVYHMRKHLGVRPFACPHCPKTYVGKYLLNQHVRVSHSSERPFKCSDCELAFKSTGNRHRHHQVVHLGIRGSFPCPVCGSTFTTKSCVKVHLRAVHGGGGWPKRDRSKRNTKRQDTKQSDSEYNDSNTKKQKKSDSD